MCLTLKNKIHTWIIGYNLTFLRDVAESYILRPCRLKANLFRNKENVKPNNMTFDSSAILYILFDSPPPPGGNIIDRDLFTLGTSIVIITVRQSCLFMCALL